MSMMTATYPLTGMSAAMPAATTTAKRPWGFWATLGWFGVAFVTFFVAAIGVGFAYGLTWALTQHGTALDPNAPILTYAVTIVSVPAAAAMLVFAARRAGWSVRDYLGLVMPTWRQALFGFGVMVAFFVFLGVTAYLFPSVDQSSVMTSEYGALTGNMTALVLYWLVLVVSAPVAEEIIFRGFLFRGWSESKLGGFGALMLTSLIFGAIHLQYSVQGMIAVVGMGLMFGVVRWRTGSTVLTIMMHAAWNLWVGTAVALSI
jgi:membrane protease YdiL (CAAX protease family)